VTPKPERLLHPKDTTHRREIHFRVGGSIFSRCGLHGKDLKFTSDEAKVECPNCNRLLDGSEETMTQITAEYATSLSDEELNEAHAILSIEWEYREAAQNVPIPEGYEVVREGKALEGDLCWCPQHDQWEAGQEGSAYWAFILLVRPKGES